MTVINLSSTNLAASDLAEMLLEKLDLVAAVEACNREIYIAEAMSRDNELMYWGGVKAQVLTKAGVSKVETSHRQVYASPQEGRQLNLLFARIADPVARAMILAEAERRLRLAPIG